MQGVTLDGKVGASQLGLAGQLDGSDSPDAHSQRVSEISMTLQGDTEEAEEASTSYRQHSGAALPAGVRNDPLERMRMEALVARQRHEAARLKTERLANLEAVRVKPEAQAKLQMGTKLPGTFQVPGDTRSKLTLSALTELDAMSPSERTPALSKLTAGQRAQYAAYSRTSEKGRARWTQSFIKPNH